MVVKDGGPAFPGYVHANPGEWAFSPSGISKRDWFAGQVISRLHGSFTPQMAAQHAYEVADAMLAEREKGGA